MNTRIEELLNLATEDILGVPLVNQEKFAELIIKDAIAIANDQYFAYEVVDSIRKEFQLE